MELTLDPGEGLFTYFYRAVKFLIGLNASELTPAIPSVSGARVVR